MRALAVGLVLSLAASGAALRPAGVKRAAQIHTRRNALGLSFAALSTQLLSPLAASADGKTAAAPQHPTPALILPASSLRRSILPALTLPALISPPAALIYLSGETQLEVGGALGATCMGFGCNPYSNPQDNGMPAEDAPKGSLPYPDFLKALKEKKVEGVVFMPPSGDEAYALM